MVDQGGVEVGHQGVRKQLAVAVRHGLAQQQRHVLVQEAARGEGVTPLGAGLTGQEQVEFVDGAAQQRAAEGPQPLDGGCAGTQRGRTAQQRGLELALGVVEECREQPGAVAETAEDRALAHAGRGGDRLHREGARAVLGDQALGGLQEPGAVARGVGAQAGLVLVDPDAQVQQLGWTGVLLRSGEGRQGGGHEASVKHREENWTAVRLGC